MKVAVLGCGPAGLAAAHAALALGHNVAVISNKIERSVLRGCQYLHAPIPGYEDVRKTTVTYSLTGTSEEYRHKVYGDTWRGKVSPEDFIGQHDAWDIRETYGRMWSDIILMHLPKLFTMDISMGNLDEVRTLEPDRIISTIPARNLCRDSSHLFVGHDIYAHSYAEGDVSDDDYVMCNGTDATAWYRVANVFKHMTVEWPEKGFHLQGATKVTKPLYTNCICNAEVIRSGRYGQWNKSVLVHQVFGQVTAALGGAV